jgi:hypothetical protein
MMNDKHGWRSFIFGLLIIIAVLSTLASITYLIINMPEKDPCVKNGLWMFVSPGYEPKVVELFPGEGGYKIAKTTGILLIWENGKVTGSVRIYEHTFHGNVSVENRKSKGYCGTISLEITEQIYVDQPWWTLTEDA